MHAVERCGFVFRHAIPYTQCGCKCVGKRGGTWGLFRKGQRGQSSWFLGTKERVAGFLSGGGVFITPFHEPMAHSGLIPISEVQISFKTFFAVVSQ